MEIIETKFAPFGRRTLARLIDLAILSVVSWMISIIYFAVGLSIGFYEELVSVTSSFLYGSNPFFEYFSFNLMIITFFVYYPLFDRFGGTVGKRLTSLTTYCEYKSRMVIFKYLLKGFLLCAYVFFIYIVIIFITISVNFIAFEILGLILILLPLGSLRKRRHCFHDRISGIYVIFKSGQ